MRSTPRFRIRFLFLTTAILVVGACGSDHNQRGADRATVRMGDGQYNAASADQYAGATALPDPMEQHLRARKLVDPNNPHAPNKYAVAYVPPEYQPGGHVNAPAPGHKPVPEQQVAAVEPVERVHITHNPLSVSPTPAHQAVTPRAVATQDAVRTVSVVDTPVISNAANVEAAHAVSRVKPASGAAAAVVTALRMGDHPGKTRLVLDMTGASDYQFDLDNDKHILFIELPAANWSAEEQRVFANHPLILAYIAKPSDSGGTLLAVKLRRNAEVVFKSSYLPDQGRPHRIVFDVAAS